MKTEVDRETIAATKKNAAMRKILLFVLRKRKGLIAVIFPIIA